MALIHHLDIKRVRDEMWRILRVGGFVILREPTRFSKGYAWLRGLLPAKDDISDYEHPLTREELATMVEPFNVQGTRYFRLPFVPLISRTIPSRGEIAWKVSNSIIKRWAGAERYATGVVADYKKWDRRKRLFLSTAQGMQSASHPGGGLKNVWVKSWLAIVFNDLEGDDPAAFGIRIAPLFSTCRFYVLSMFRHQ